MGVRRFQSHKLITAGAVAVTALVAAGGTTAGAQAATVTVGSGTTSTWTGYVTSPTDASRRLTTISPTLVDAATIGITVDPNRKSQVWQGVGASLTDSSLALLTNRDAAVKALYDPTSATGARLNLLRLPMSGTDFSTSHWTFGYRTATRTLTAPAEAVNAAKAVVAVKSLRSDLTVIGTPWTAPATMKSSKTTNGGALAAGQEAGYAAMLQSQVDWYKSKNVAFKYLSIVNEPGYSNSTYPTMTMTDAQLSTVARTIASPLKKKGVGLLAVDHNFSDRGRVDTALSSTPNAYAAAAFHCYDGSPAQMSGVSVPSIVTECTSSQGDDATYGFAYLATVLVQNAVDNGSTGLMMWNLALSPTGGPKLAGGCDNCRGLLTVDPATGAVTANPEFYALAHLSRAADPGASVITSDVTADIPVAAFQNTDGTQGVFGVNTYDAAQVISVRVAGGAERRFKIGAGEMFTFRGQAGTAESLLGKIVRTATGTVAYVDLSGVSHAVTSQSTYDCLGGVSALVDNLPVAALAALPAGDPATCDLVPVTGAVTGPVTGVATGTASDLPGSLTGSTSDLDSALSTSAASSTASPTASPSATSSASPSASRTASSTTTSSASPTTTPSASSTTTSSTSPTTTPTASRSAS